jgi:parallel beta-helix repeat protein
MYNEFFNHSDGLYLRKSENNNISYNVFKNNSVGIRLFTFSNSNYFSFNNISYSNNGVYTHSGINNIYFKNLLFNNSNYGFYLRSSSSKHILIENTILNSGNDGIYLYNSPDSYLESNIIRNSFNYGLNIYSWNITVVNNSIYDNNVSNIYFKSILSGPYTQLVYGNYLGNLSKVNSDNWSLWNINFNSSLLGNKYDNFSGVYCFDSPTNNSCDYFASVFVAPLIPVLSDLSPATISLPSFGFWSSVVSFCLVSLFFLF